MPAARLVTRTLLIAACTSVSLATPAAAHHSPGEPIADAPVDCGADHRSPFDGQPDVDYPTPPPSEAQPLLTALGCPEGEPTYEDVRFGQWNGDSFDPQGTPPAASSEKPKKAKRRARTKCGRAAKAKAKTRASKRSRRARCAKRRARARS